MTIFIGKESRLITATLILWLAAGVANAQYKVDGTVTDSLNGSPLAFVNIVIKGTNTGTYTDIDGQFSLQSNNPITELQFSYIGYEWLTLNTAGQHYLDVKLVPQANQLEGIEIIAGENPAHRIIRQASENRPLHDPLNYESFTCNTYSKFYYSYWPKIDSIASVPDSSEAELFKFLEEHHLFISESITKKTYSKPGKHHEEVLATKVSGFQNPEFALVGTDYQPFSFYNDYVELYSQLFFSPLAPGSTNKYFFQLTDTVFSGPDTSYTITFEPRKGTNFDALEGAITINTNGFAIENITARPHYKGINDIRIQQNYQYVNGGWFPAQLNVDLFFEEAELALFGRTYVTNVNTDSVKSAIPLIALVVNDTAGLRSEEYWQQYRHGGITEKDERTYHFIDSVGAVHKFDSKVNIMSSLIEGTLPLGFFNLDVLNLLSGNGYEGFRASVGLYTNEKISRYFSLGGYAAYGFKDEAIKYGLRAEIYPVKNKDYKIGAAYSRDVMEPGGTSFSGDQTNLLRQLVVGVRDSVTAFSVYGNARLFRYVKVGISHTVETRTFLNNYQFERSNELMDRATFSKFGVSIKYAFGERQMEMFGKLITVPSTYPVIEFNYERGSTTFDGEYKYDKFGASFYDEFRVVGWRPTQLTIEYGYVNPQVPYSELFFGKGSYTDQTSMFVPQTFQTMRPFEFLSNNYVSLSITQSIARFQFNFDRFKPEILVVGNIMFGSLEHGQYHKGVPFNTLENGYTETGLIVKDFWRVKYMDLAYFGIMAGAYYRCGYYAYPDMTDNLAFKIGLTFSL